MTFFDYPTGNDGSPGSSDVSARGQAVQIFLADASEQDWIDLLAQARRRTVEPGETVISRGDVGRSLFLVIDGNLEVRTRAGRFGGTRRSIGPGSVIGEVAFFDGEARSADVVATTPGQLAELTPESLEALAEQRPLLSTAVLLDLGRILAQRLRMKEEESEWNRR